MTIRISILISLSFKCVQKPHIPYHRASTQSEVLNDPNSLFPKKDLPGFENI